MHGLMQNFLAVVSGHCTLFLPGKLREGPKRNEAVIVRRPASYYLHYKIGLRVIVGAKLYHFCIAFHLIFLHGIFAGYCRVNRTFRAISQGLYYLFSSANSCCRKITSTCLFCMCDCNNILWPQYDFKRKENLC